MFLSPSKSLLHLQNWLLSSTLHSLYKDSGSNLGSPLDSFFTIFHFLFWACQLNRISYVSWLVFGSILYSCPLLLTINILILSPWGFFSFSNLSNSIFRFWNLELEFCFLLPILKLKVHLAPWFYLFLACHILPCPVVVILFKFLNFYALIEYKVWTATCL